MTLTLKKRKWNNDYVRFGFTHKKLDSQKPQYMLSETFFHEKFEAIYCILQEHFENNMEGAVLWAVIEKSLQAEKACFYFRTTLPKSCIASVDKLLLMASYQVAFKRSKTCET